MRSKLWQLPDHPLLSKVEALWNKTEFTEKWPSAFVSGSEVERITKQAQRELEKFIRMLERARLVWDAMSPGQQRDALTQHPIGSQPWEVQVAGLLESALDALNTYRGLAARKAELDRLTIEENRKSNVERTARQAREAEAHAAKKRALRERMVASKEARARAEDEHRSNLFARLEEQFANSSGSVTT